MSRIYRHQQHQQKRRIVIFLVLIVIVMIMLFKLGFRSLIDSAIVISSFGDKKEVVQKGDDSFVGFLQLEEPVTATNSAAIEVEGSAQDYDKLMFYINDDIVEEVAVRGKTFSEVIEGLVPGENTVYVKAVSKDGKHTDESEIYTIMYADKPPEITVDSPRDNDTVRLADLKISGSTKPGANLRINNQPVVVGFGGSFNTSIRLKEGDNELHFTATDIAGNSATLEMKVKYEKND